jgi:hypothetical protein
MARFWRDLEIRSPYVRELRDTGTVGTVGSLRLRVHGSHVDAYVPITSSYISPPRFSGEVTSDSAGTVVHGRIKESLTNATWTRVDACAIVIMLACVVLGVVGLTTSYSAGGLAPLLIGVLGTPAFAVLFSVHRRQRRAEWRQQSATLVDELTRYVENG